MHKVFIKKLVHYYTLDWESLSQKQVVSELAGFKDELHSFRDYLVPSSHKVSGKVNALLSRCTGVYSCCCTDLVTKSEAMSMIQKMRVYLKEVRNILLQVPEYMPLAPFFPEPKGEEQESLSNTLYEPEEKRAMPTVKDIDSLTKLSDKNIRAGVRAMGKTKQFGLVEGAGLFPTLTDYEYDRKAAQKMGAVEINDGELGYFALQGETLLLVDTKFQAEREGNAAQNAQSDMKADMKTARAAVRGVQNELEALQEEADGIREKMSAGSTSTKKSSEYLVLKKKERELDARLSKNYEDLDLQDKRGSTTKEDQAKQEALAVKIRTELTTVRDKLTELARAMGESKKGANLGPRLDDVLRKIELKEGQLELRQEALSNLGSTTRRAAKEATEFLETDSITDILESINKKAGTKLQLMSMKGVRVPTDIGGKASVKMYWVGSPIRLKSLTSRLPIRVESGTVQDWDIVGRE